MHSIRVKIVSIAVAAILTTILSVYAVASMTIRTESEKDSVEKMNLIGENARQSLEKYFDNIQQSVNMASLVATDSLDSVILVESGAAGAAAQVSERSQEDVERLDAYLAEYIQSVQETSTSIASHTQGIVTYYYCISPSISKTQHGFYNSRVGKTGFKEEEPLDASTLDPRDMEHSTWYYTPIHRGRPSWIGPYPSKTLDEMWICSYLAPIYRAGEFIGVLGMDIPVDTLIEQIRSITVYKTGYAVLLDENGNVIYHPEIPMGTAIDIYGLLSQDASLLQKDSSEDRLIRYEFNGEKRQLSFSTLGNGMKLAIIAPMDEINDSWNRMVRYIEAVTAGALVFFSALLMVVMGVITRPLQKLTAAAQRLALADYNVTLDYKGKDEVGVLTRSFSMMRDQLRLYFEDLNRRIKTDELTGLPNMRYFFKLAKEEKERILKEDGSPVMLFLNLIGMKHYNRQYGFDEGDKLICEVAKILEKHYGKEKVSRFNQDHFTVVTEEKGLENGLRDVFRECEQANNGKALPVRAGIYLDRLGDVNASSAFDRAKYACDKHRESYVSGFYYFDETMLKQVDNVRYVINNLDKALKERWVQVYYQPIIRSVNGRVCDEEALSRWIDPEKGLMSPADFIPILETARLIYKFDLYVLEQILEKIHFQQKEGMQVVPQSLNLSRADFESCDIVEEVRRRVDDAGVSHDKITIEVTEGILADDFEFMKSQIERFQALGFHVWMDDFGSGYSTIDVLRDIRFDLVKFDMRFMQRFDDGEESRIMLTELIRMTIGLNLDTVCEGVESFEQVEFLRDLGCSKIQGFFYGRPRPFNELVERNRQGLDMGFENPEESSYYGAIGRLNMYSLAMLAKEDYVSIKNLFDGLPMGVLELDGNTARILRMNSSYRVFMKRYFERNMTSRFSCSGAILGGTEVPFAEEVQGCIGNGNLFFDKQLPDGSVAHCLARMVACNSVTGAVSVAIAILSICGNRFA